VFPCSAIDVDAAELSLKPLGELHYKPLGGAMVFTCEVTMGDEDEDGTEYTIRWFDKNGREIADKTGRSVSHDHPDETPIYSVIIIIITTIMTLILTLNNNDNDNNAI